MNAKKKEETAWQTDKEGKGSANEKWKYYEKLEHAQIKKKKGKIV